MNYGYARVSTDGQSVAAQVQQLTAVGCSKVFREVASGAKTDGAQLRRALAKLEEGDVLVGQSLGRPHKLTLHQRREVVSRKDADKSVREIARSYAMSPSTISRLTAMTDGP
jgi:Resolvase, N terminal domain/Helix-turn-helix domain